MRNEKLVALLMATSTVFGGFSIQPAYALDSDLNYSYKTEQNEEFVITGATALNYNGEIPDYLRNIYDFSPQTVYNSEYGSNIIEAPEVAVNETTYAPYYAPVNTYTQSVGSTVAGTTQSRYTANSGSSSEIPDFTYSNESLQYPLTTIEQVRNDDGSIGVLRIPDIDLKVTAYDGDTFTAMKKGIGHISSTSCWNGNIGLVGHNRGTSDYFGKLKKLDVGDEMTYTTNLGKRTYVVTSITRIKDTDWSRLQYTSDNRLTLITCVENVSDQRLCVQAVEKR